MIIINPQEDMGGRRFRPMTLDEKEEPPFDARGLPIRG
jgi:hypothetical protein